MENHIYLGLMYCSSHYDHSNNERVHESYLAYYTPSLEKLTDRMARACAEESCYEYSLFIDGVLVYERTPIEKSSDHGFGDHAWGKLIAKSISEKTKVLLDKEREDAAAKAEQDRIDYARKRESIERAKLAELLAKYGTGVQDA